MGNEPSKSVCVPASRRVRMPASKPWNGFPPEDDPPDPPAAPELLEAPGPVPFEQAFAWQVWPICRQSWQAMFAVPQDVSELPDWQTPMLSQHPPAHDWAPNAPPAAWPELLPWLELPPSPDETSPPVEPPHAPDADSAGKRIPT